MPIGTIIGFLLGGLIAAVIVILSETDMFAGPDQRTIACITLAQHRSRYLFWLLSCTLGLAGTFIEMLSS